MVSGSATADYGSISGGIFVGIDSGDASGSYGSSFGEQVIVLGGSGDGTLITHYQLVSFDAEERATGLTVPPSYQFQQGLTTINYTPFLPHPNFNPVSSLTEDFDVTSRFTFGEPFLLSAYTHAEYRNPQTGGRAFILQTSSSAQITGYTVLDSGGAVAADAIVERTAIPEPGTLWLGMAGVLMIVVNRGAGLTKRHRALGSRRGSIGL